MAGKRTKPDVGEAPALEWAAGGLGALVFIAMMAVLVSTGLSGADAPPSIAVRVERIVQADGSYVVEFTARNEGEMTAADVEIVAELTTGSDMEERRARFDYLPPHSKRRGGFFFENDPRAGALSIRADGYNDP